MAKTKAKATGSKASQPAKQKTPREKKPRVSKAAAAGFPICVRHGAAAKDAALRYYFLCDDCTGKWKVEAFDGNAPLYSGEAVRGYCQLCNRDLEVRLRTWFLCNICDRVTASIGRNHVAEQTIVDFWQEHVQPSAAPGVDQDGCVGATSSPSHGQDGDVPSRFPRARPPHRHLYLWD